ncbi:WxL domain-containing protein [Bacillus safensis]|uniref:WxL domain-containing protein n=1 Tax=Bacillus safensis TaxID=561879 RepID=UPI002041BC06|nr:WxL domain-containing protein [Bacillus safensis]MCM3140357.1 WxL domain-containing protein [Bacillus safensis]
MKKRNYKKLIVTMAALVTLFVGNTVLAAEGSNDGNSSATTKGSIEIQGGTFSVAFLNNKDKIFDFVNLNNTFTSNVPLGGLLVTDFSGTGNGYEVTLKATQFKSVSSDKKIPTGSLKLNSVPLGQPEGSYMNPNAIAPKNIGENIILDGSESGTGGVIISADKGEGMGQFKYVFKKDDLTFSANRDGIYKGTYETVITADMHVPVK